jgi:hypothetical protein
MKKHEAASYQDCISSPLPNGDTLYYGRVRMTDNGSNTRIAYFRTPNLKKAPFEDEGVPSSPTILATIDGMQTGGTQTMLVYGISIIDEGPYTYFNVDTQTPTGNAVPDIPYWCNITIIGTPL